MGYKVVTQHTHVQDTPSSTWTVVHNFGSYPVMDVYIELSGELTRVFPTVTFVDLNTCTAVFTSAQTGLARCS